MKKLILFSAVLILTLPSFAQVTPINKGTSFGFHLNQYQNDYGLGINVTSPYFAGDRLAVRLRGSVMNYQHIEGQTTTWTPYSNFTLGFVSEAGTINDRIRLYGEGGIVGIMPNEKFSSENFNLGGYGLFGFEFYMHNAHAYFIEIGGMGSGSKADKLPFKPIYSNGLMINVGYRVVLK